MPDTTSPTVAISDTKGQHLVINQTDTITFQFSEEVQGFDNSDVIVTGGTLGTITVDGADPTKYTATFTPDVTDTLAATIKVNAGGYTDLASNPGTASAVFSITGDTEAPPLTVSLKTRYRIERQRRGLPFGRLHGYDDAKCYCSIFSQQYRQCYRKSQRKRRMDLYAGLSFTCSRGEYSSGIRRGCGWVIPRH